MTETIRQWSEDKLNILRDYAAAYSTILSKKTNLKHIYIDAFAGSGKYISETTGKIVPGSPIKVLEVKPPFYEYHFVEKDPKKLNELKKLTEEYPKVHIYGGDCNEKLLKIIFPKVKYEDYKRALCFLDPYGIHLEWKVIQQAGKMKSVEIFLNFAILDMRRNVLRRNLNKVNESQIVRMNKFWGDDSWRNLLSSSQLSLNLFKEKKYITLEYKNLAKEFQSRLKKVAEFKFVPITYFLPHKTKLGTKLLMTFSISTIKRELDNGT
jgi:three-Cys-motif partner protein